MSSESTIKIRHDSDVTKSVKRKEVVQTQSKSKASVSKPKERRNVVNAALASKLKNVDEHALGSEPKDDAAEEPLKPVPVKTRGFDTQIQIETFQNMVHDSGILSHEGTHMSVDEKSVIALSDIDLYSVVVSAVKVSDEDEQFDDLQTSQKLITLS
ncbi:hypothetical protein K7X08_033320 [Anisodus acutangulus]|uniref:Uncharacterized protein n=1 Tax=Anisodus acutangulus TaxID=402998 RepID=A0A9Q1M1T6_9SOLA|nr:hypothetical protein K7X08_033320 [Anisodus acutangulus]